MKEMIAGELTVGKLIEELSKYEADTIVVIDSIEGIWIDMIRSGFVSRDSDMLYYDLDNAIEEEADDWGGELEEVVCIRYRPFKGFPYEQT